jgi:hypothetical protein
MSVSATIGRMSESGIDEDLRLADGLWKSGKLQEAEKMFSGNSKERSKMLAGLFFPRRLALRITTTSECSLHV